MKNYYKAIAGFIASALVAYLGATDGGVTRDEWLLILVAGLGGSGLVAVAPKNVPKQKGEAGTVDIGLLLLIVILVFVLLLFFRVHA